MYTYIYIYVYMVHVAHACVVCRGCLLASLMIVLPLCFAHVSARHT